MKVISKTLIFQIVWTLTVITLLMTTYYILSAEDIYRSEIFLNIVRHPEGILILSMELIAVCIILGLPIRLNSKLRKWWLDNPEIQTLALASSLLIQIIYLNLDHGSTDTYIEGKFVSRKVFEIVLPGITWIIVTFTLLHMYPESFATMFKRKSSKNCA